MSPRPIQCTNIPHNEGFRECEEDLHSQEPRAPLTAHLCHLIRLVLSMNSFVFDSNHYLQIHGTGMGTHMARSYAFVSGEIGIQDPRNPQHATSSVVEVYR